MECLLDNNNTALLVQKTRCGRVTLKFTILLESSLLFNSLHCLFYL